MGIPGVGSHDPYGGAGRMQWGRPYVSYPELHTHQRASQPTRLPSLTPFFFHAPALSLHSYFSLIFLPRLLTTAREHSARTTPSHVPGHSRSHELGGSNFKVQTEHRLRSVGKQGNLSQAAKPSIPSHVFWALSTARFANMSPCTFPALHRRCSNPLHKSPFSPDPERGCNQ